MSPTHVVTADDRTAVNAQRAERRRHVARAVRDMREQLTSVSGVKPAFDYELLLAHAHNRVASSVASAILTVIVALVATFWTAPGLVVLWLVLALSAHLTAILFALRFTRLDREATSVKGWRNRLVTVDALSGFVTASLFALPIQSVAQVELYVFASVLILVAVGTMIGSNLPAAMLGATVPITLVASSAFLLTGTEATIGVAAMMLVAQAFFVMLGFRLYDSALGVIESRAEKDALIAELEQAKAISDESRRKAEEANLAKSRFLATMSHELRTPLNAILGFSEVMKNEFLGPIENPTYKDYVSDIHASGQHLLNLINEILDLSRIEAGRHALNEEQMTLPYTVEECVHMMSLRARNKGITLQEAYQDGLPKIWADERAVRQIVLNLLSNAVKFTPSGGTVSVKVGWTAGGGQYVSVKDTGPGIPEDELPIVLSPFGQGAVAIKSAEQGTGLGLNIVQALVRMHGGTFDLKSKLREGTEAIVTFPASRVLEVMPAITERPVKKDATRLAG